MADVAAAERDEGLRRQLAALGSREVGGWKVGLTSGQARDSMGRGFRPFGYILKERIYRADDTSPVFRLADFERVGVENEMCFRLRETLRGDASRDDAIAAVAGAMPAFEINEQRLGAGASVADRLADDLNQYAIVVGREEVLDWRHFDLRALCVVLRRNDEIVQTVEAKGHIDDHFDSIAALARQLDHFGRSLDAGSYVITGAHTRQAVTQPSRYRGDFGHPFAPVRVEFQ